MRLVIFDIDNTLVVGPSTERRFFGHLLCNGKLGAVQWASYVAGLVCWAPKYGRQILQKNKGYLNQLEETEIARQAMEWAETRLESALFKPALDRLRAHQAAGDHVVLLSGTPEFVAAAIASRLGVADYIGSICASTGGRFSFEPLQRHPCGIEKVRLASELASALGFNPAQCVAYGDSVHDAALLDWAGTAVAVRPGYRLSMLAKANGWERLGQRLLLP